MKQYSPFLGLSCELGNRFIGGPAPVAYGPVHTDGDESELFL